MPLITGKFFNAPIYPKFHHPFVTENILLHAPVPWLMDPMGEHGIRVTNLEWEQLQGNTQLAWLSSTDIQKKKTEVVVLSKFNIKGGVNRVIIIGWSHASDMAREWLLSNQHHWQWTVGELAPAFSVNGVLHGLKVWKKCCLDPLSTTQTETPTSRGDVSCMNVRARDPGCCTKSQHRSISCRANS